MMGYREDQAWAAGLFEGEGCITVQRQRGRKNHPRLQLNMTDEDTVRRFHRVVGSGAVRFKPATDDVRKDQWAWVSACLGARTIMEWMYPMLGDRRRARWREVKEICYG